MDPEYVSLLTELCTLLGEDAYLVSLQPGPRGAWSLVTPLGRGQSWTLPERHEFGLWSEGGRQAYAERGHRAQLEALRQIVALERARATQ